jgi:hypothetical protein
MTISLASLNALRSINSFDVTVALEHYEGVAGVEVQCALLPFYIQKA